MYSYIKGTYVDRSEKAVVIEAAGVGYYIEMGRNLSNKLGELDSEVICYVHYNIGQYDQRLFGFPTKEYKELFELLITVSGVGPKAAISLSDEFDPSELALLIVREDVKTIVDRMRGKGFGKKSAERVILELKDKFKDINFDDLDEVEETISVSVDNDFSSIKNDLLQGLSFLGYRTDEAKRMINANFDADLDMETNLKNIIKTANKG